jgi:hypothetical protein
MIRATWGLRAAGCSPAMSTAFELMCLAIRLLEMGPHHRPKWANGGLARAR